MVSSEAGRAAVSRASSAKAGFADAARLQAIVIGALMMRELHTRYGRENLGFLWMVMEPMLFCLGVIIIWSLAHGRYTHGSITVTGFVMTGDRKSVV